MDSAVDYYLEKGYIRQECGEHNRNFNHHFLIKNNIHIYYAEEILM